MKWRSLSVRLLIVGVAVAMLLMMPGSAFASPCCSTTMTVQASNGLRLRTGPSLADSVVLTLQNGETVYKIGGPVWNQGISWTHVRVYRWGYYYEGFCASAYLSNYGGYAGPSESGLMVTAGGLNLRSGPGLGYGVRRIVPYGTVLQPTGATQWGGGRQWTQVAVNGTYLWAASAYLVGV